LPNLRRAPLQQESCTGDDTDDTKSRIGDEYILVKKSAKTSVFTKTDPSLDLKLDVPKLVRLGGPKMGISRAMRAGVKGRVITAKLFVKQVIAPGANTALASSYALTPSAAAEFSSFANLFDEIKVDKIDIRYASALSLGGSYSASNGFMLAIGYDSTYDTTPSSAAEVLESQQSMLVIVGGSNGITNNTLPSASTATGLHLFPIKIPKGPVANASAVTGGTGLIANFPGQWMRIGDTSDSVGYRRVYSPAQGASNLLTYEEMITFHCSFRERT
jgi:hypothetical protein